MTAMSWPLGLPEVMPLAQQVGPGSLAWYAIAAAVGLVALLIASGVRYIPNSKVGVVEKLWSGRGSIPDGRIVAM